MKNDFIYLCHIRDAIMLIESFISQHERDVKTFHAVVRQLEIIGEASNRLPLDFRAQHTTIPWRKIIDMRNVLIHAYEGLSEETIWLIVTDRLPELKHQIQQLIIFTGQE